MRKYLIIGLSYILLILTVFLLYRQNVNLRVDRDMQLENVKAYSAFILRISEGFATLFEVTTQVNPCTPLAPVTTEATLQV